MLPVFFKLTVTSCIDKIVNIFFINILRRLICMCEICLYNLCFIIIETFIVVVFEFLIEIGLQQVFFDIRGKAQRATICFFNDQKIANLDTVFIIDCPFIKVEINWCLETTRWSRNRLSKRNTGPNWNTKLL